MSSVDHLFEGDGDGAWDALATLRQHGASDAELAEICRRVGQNEGDRCPLLLLRDIGDARGVGSLLVAARSASYDYQKQYAAEALVAVLDRCGGDVERELLEELAGLPDQHGLDYDPSSWEPASDSTVVSMRAVRETAARVLSR